MLASLMLDRHLVWELTRRDLKSRYVGSTLGVVWTVLQPLALILIFTVVFTFLARAEFVGAPFARKFHYSVYLCAGLLPWLMFQDLLQRGTGQFVEMANLIKKIPFRKAVLLWSVGLSSAVTFLVAFGLFVIFLLLIGYLPVAELVLYLAAVVLLLAFGMGLTSLAACLHVYIRDTKQLVLIGTQLWFWATPIVWFPTEHIPSWVRRAEQFNPLYWYVHSLQNLIVRKAWPAAGEWALMAACSAAALALGAVVLRATEANMADEL